MTSLGVELGPGPAEETSWLGFAGRIGVRWAGMSGGGPRRASQRSGLPVFWFPI